jgi:hypothetical protein
MKAEATEPDPYSAEDELLERMWSLHAQLKDEHPRTPAYKSLMTEIQNISSAYGRLVDASRGITRPLLNRVHPRPVQ